MQTSTFFSLNREIAHVLNMAKSNAGLVPTNKELPCGPLFGNLSHLNFSPCIKEGYKIKEREQEINKKYLFSLVIRPLVYLSLEKVKPVRLLSLGEWVLPSISKSISCCARLIMSWEWRVIGF